MRTGRTRIAACLWLAGLASAVAGFARAQPETEEVETSDIYVLVTELADEVELIREVMGRPYDDSPRLPVSAVTLFETWFHVETLALKSNRLAHELAGAPLRPRPSIPMHTLTQAEFLPLVETALADVRLVRAELGITEQVIRQQRDFPISPTGVFSVTLDTNRQLDLLLADAISSADVYGRLVTASSYAAGLLAARTGNPVPPDSPYDGPHRPAGVYRRLLECMDLMNSVAAKIDVPVVTLSSRRNVPDDIEPGHVYDLATFLIADLARAAFTLGATPVDLGITPPKHVFPSHAYQRAGVLRAQLELLDAAL